MINNTKVTGRIPDQINLMPEVGALTEWQRELHTGVRKLTDADELWRAACAEANAREWTWCPAACNQYRRLAAQIILDKFEREAA